MSRGWDSWTASGRQSIHADARWPVLVSVGVTAAAPGQSVRPFWYSQRVGSLTESPGAGVSTTVERRRGVLKSSGTVRGGASGGAASGVATAPRNPTKQLEVKE